MTYTPKHSIFSISTEDVQDAIYVPVEEDPVREPSHYKFPGGVQVIDITQHLNFCLGNVVKYTCRAGRKSGSATLQDLEKAQRYLELEIERVKAKRDEDLEQQNARLRAMGDEGVWGNA